MKMETQKDIEYVDIASVTNKSVKELLPCVKEELDVVFTKEHCDNDYFYKDTLNFIKVEPIDANYNLKLDEVPLIDGDDSRYNTHTANDDVSIKDEVIVKTKNENMIENNTLSLVNLRNIKNKLKLRLHNINNNDTDKYKKVYRCFYCSFGTVCKKQLEHHGRTKHKGIKEIHEDIMKSSKYKNLCNNQMKPPLNDNGFSKLYSCLLCSFDTDYNSQLEIHMHQMHRAFMHIYAGKSRKKRTDQQNLKRKEITDKNNHYTIIIILNIKLYKCLHCVYETDYEILLDQHFSLKHKEIEKPHKCNKCSYHSFFLNNLEKHQNGMHSQETSL